MNHISLIRLVVLKRPIFQTQKYGMSSFNPKTLPLRTPLNVPALL